MLTLDDFEAMLRRYLAGCSTEAETSLLTRWLAEAAPSFLPLTDEKLAAVRNAMWQRITEMTQTSRCRWPPASNKLMVRIRRNNSDGELSSASV